MTRARNNVATLARKKKIFKLAKGFRGRSKNCYRIAKQSVDRALQFAYRDRKVRKRNFRSLWIQRINAAAREHGLTYSQFMNGINKAGIEVDRKVMAEMAVNNPIAFKALADKALAAVK